MRSTLALLCAVPLAFGITACGSSSKPTSASTTQSSTSETLSTQSTSSSSASSEAATTTSTSTSTSTSASVTAAPPGKETAVEREVKNPNYIDPSITKYGSVASSSDASAVTALVKSYYGALSAHEYAKACTILSPRVEQTVAKISLAARGKLKVKGCAGVIPLLLGQTGGRPVSKPSEVVVKSVRVEHENGFAIIKTPTLPAGVMHVRKLNGTWRMGSLIGTPAP